MRVCVSVCVCGKLSYSAASRISSVACCRSRRRRRSRCRSRRRSRRRPRLQRSVLAELWTVSIGRQWQRQRVFLRQYNTNRKFVIPFNNWVEPLKRCTIFHPLKWVSRASVCVCILSFLFLLLLLCTCARTKNISHRKKSFLTTIITESQIECKRVCERERERSKNNPTGLRSKGELKTVCKRESGNFFFLEICEQVAHAGMFSLV